MPYPAPFHRLVLIGNLYADQFNTTLSIVPSFLTEWFPMAPVGEDTLDAVTDIVSTWWAANLSATGPGFSANARLMSVKLNRIGTDGRYMDPETMEFDLTPGIPGAVNSNPAPQLSIASSLSGANPRQRAGRGRMFLPPIGALTTLGSDGRVPANVALQSAQATAHLIGELNALYTGVGQVGIASKGGPGGFQAVTLVRAGRVPDTIRSRRSKQQEDYQEAPV